MVTDDMTLLREYARRNSEEAFANLVSRHADLVYSVALRMGREPQLAQEITHHFHLKCSFLFFNSSRGREPRLAARPRLVLTRCQAAQITFESRSKPVMNVPRLRPASFEWFGENCIIK
jgi:hypothetical protein